MGSSLRTFLIGLGLMALLAVPASSIGRGAVHEGKLGLARSATQQNVKGFSKAKKAKSHAHVKGIGHRGKAPQGAAVFPDGTWLPPELKAGWVVGTPLESLPVDRPGKGHKTPKGAVSR